MSFLVPILRSSFFVLSSNLRGRLLPLAAAFLLFCALWIVVPAPHLLLLPLGVGVPELSPFLLLASALVCALALRVLGADTRPTNQLGSPMRQLRWRSGLTVGVALVAGILSAVPVVQLPGVIERFDAVLPAAENERRHPVSVRELVIGLDTAASRVVRGVPFATPSGVPLTLDIYRPLSAGRFPILVQIYGGAWQRGAPGDNAEFAQYFASRGYVVCAIEYRHAPRWQWPAQIEDVRAALAWIRAHAAEYDGDIARIALIGRSAGAQLALLAAYESNRDQPDQPDPPDHRAPQVSAVVSYYGPTDLPEGWRTPPRPDPLNVRAVLETYLGGTPDEVPAHYRDASPIAYVSAALPPTLLLYGTRDHIVEARFGRELHHRLQSAGASSVLLEIPWAEHAFDAIPSGLSGQLLRFYTERFLAQTLR